MGVIRDDHFDIDPLDLAARCTPQSIGAHTLYENADPFLLTEPSGVINTQHANYVANSERSVLVSGSTFTVAKEYTIKLEGAQLVGHQTAVIGGIRDPYIIRSLEPLLPKASAYVDSRRAEHLPGQFSR